MSGHVSGVEARITNLFPKAKYFTHYGSHCLNLVIVSSCTKVPEIRNFMHAFKELTLLFGYSAKRKDLVGLKKKKKNMNTKLYYTTCESSCQSAHDATSFMHAMKRFETMLLYLHSTRWGLFARCLSTSRESLSIAASIEVVPSKPRTVGQQRHRANSSSDKASVQNHYRLNNYLPFLDHIISHMKTRFPAELEGA
ncbi:LOW QUALITY PROTEIN: hypothetical protein MAR_015755, partial [Mya arenaria]